ncbi:MAG: hypothetical protein R6X02_31695 [Enhygromyxa sp.]
MQTLREVEALNEAINAGEPVREQLFDALARFRHYAPVLAADPEARAVRARAQLNLARTYLSDGATASAAGIVDEVLRSTIGEELPVEEFGPSLAALHAERRAALERGGTASIQFDCRVPCQAYVNERAVGGRIDGLYLGIYRIWIDAVGLPEAEEFHVEWIKLSKPNQTYTVEFVVFSPSSSADHPRDRPRLDRLMPRPVEIALLAAGGSIATTGAVMLGLRGDRGGSSVIAGAALTGLGAAALIVGGTTLAIDEVRLGPSRGRQAMLVWRMNF